MAVEWYYNRTPTSPGSTTSRPPVLDECEVDVDGNRIGDIFRRLVRERVIILDAQGVPWSGPSIPAMGQPTGTGRSEAAGPGMRRNPRPTAEEMPQPTNADTPKDTGARSSNEPPYYEEAP